MMNSINWVENNANVQSERWTPPQHIQNGWTLFLNAKLRNVWKDIASAQPTRIKNELNCSLKDKSEITVYEHCQAEWDPITAYTLLSGRCNHLHDATTPRIWWKLLQQSPSHRRCFDCNLSILSNV